MDDLRFEIFEDACVFPRLKAGWDRLCDELVSQVTVFASSVWYENWWQFYGGAAKLHLFTMWSGENLVGIAPLMWKKSSFRGLPVRTVGFIQNNHSLHNEFIVRPEFRVAFFHQLIQSLFAQSARWDVIQLRNLSCVSDDTSALVSILGEEGRSWNQNWTNIESPFLVPEGSWEDFWAARSTRVRKSMRNIHNRLHAGGKVSIKNITTQEEFLACKDDLFAVAQQSWSEGGGDSLGSSRNREFFTGLACRAAARGWLSIWVLSLDERVIAVEFHLRAYGREHALRGHYHPEFSSLSPGTFLERHILEQVFMTARRVQIYDFCGGFDSYKKKWTEAYVPHCDVHVYKDAMYSKCAMCLDAKLAPLVKKAIQYGQKFRNGGKGN